MGLKDWGYSGDGEGMGGADKTPPNKGRVR